MKRVITRRLYFSFLVLPALAFLVSCAGLGGISAEEYYSLGMAFMDLGRYEEAENWFVRAKRVAKTRDASEYNLGRIAYETGRYEEAADIFAGILRKDPENITVLKAAAYTAIKLGDYETAEAHYKEVRALVPESADDGYNYALVLFAMEKPDEAEAVLFSFPVALLENKDVMLLHARIQRAQKKVEAIDTYGKWLKNYTDPVVEFEYAEILEEEELYVRAIEVLGKIAELDETERGKDISIAEVNFSRARLFMIADSQSSAGIDELRGVIDSGYKDIEKVKTLLENEKISASHKDEIRRLIDGMERDAASEAEAASDAEAEAASRDGTGAVSGEASGEGTEPTSGAEAEAAENTAGTDGEAASDAASETDVEAGSERSNE